MHDENPKSLEGEVQAEIAANAWPPHKIIASLTFIVLVFAAGVIIGRGGFALSIGRLHLAPKIYVHSLTATTQSLADTNSNQLDYSSLNTIYNLLKKDFDGKLDKARLLDGAKSGLVSAAGDPYTQFFNPQAAKDFNDQLAGSFSGIGAELGTDSDNHIVIVSPISGYAADKAGLKPKDIIAGINSQTTNGQSVDAAVQKIRGPVGTKVTLTIIRGGGQPFDVTLTRQQITLPSVQSHIDGNIGYLKISQFSNDTAGLAQKAAQDFKDHGVRGVVVDLRGNPGGYLQSAVQVSSLWLDQGKTVVSERRDNAIIDTEYALGNNILKGLPTVVLINTGSASASEITAGALKDNNVAVLIGEKSFGKGSVQQVESLAGGAEVKITIARWYTPAGKNIDKEGISPDVEVSLTDANQQAGQDPQKDKAYQILQSKF